MRLAGRRDDTLGPPPRRSRRNQRYRADPHTVDRRARVPHATPHDAGTTLDVRCQQRSQTERTGLPSSERRPLKTNVQGSRMAPERSTRTNDPLINGQSFCLIAPYPLHHAKLYGATFWLFYFCGPLDLGGTTGELEPFSSTSSGTSSAFANTFPEAANEGAFMFGITCEYVSSVRRVLAWSRPRRDAHLRPRAPLRARGASRKSGSAASRAWREARASSTQIARDGRPTSRIDDNKRVGRRRALFR